MGNFVVVAVVVLRRVLFTSLDNGLVYETMGLVSEKGEELATTTVNQSSNTSIQFSWVCAFPRA